MSTPNFELLLKENVFCSLVFIESLICFITCLRSVSKNIFCIRLLHEEQYTMLFSGVALIRHPGGQRDHKSCYFSSSCVINIYISDNERKHRPTVILKLTEHRNCIFQYRFRIYTPNLQILTKGYTNIHSC